MKNIMFGLLVIWTMVGCGGGGSSSANISTEITEEISSTSIENVKNPKNVEVQSLIYDMTLTWESDTSIENYEVSYKKEDEEKWNKMIVKNAEYSMTNLKPNTQYYFRIRAKDYKDNYSKYSVIDKKTLKDTKDKAIILVHGLDSGASTWNLMAPKLSKVMGVENNAYVEIAIDTDINESSECWDAKREDEKIKCQELDDIDKQESFRKILSQSDKIIFGLDKGNFDVASIKWRLNSTKTEVIKNDFSKYKKYQKQRVFAINFSNKNQLTFDAQGYELYKIIENIKKVTGITKFDIVGHSMGGLAIRAYIQNENIENIGQYISIDTPHFGAGKGIYTGITGRNAAVNLDSESKSIQLLNNEEKVIGKYDAIKVYHLGYSDGLQGLLDDGDYYDEGDGIVNIGSQMGLDSLNPTRIIFSPTIKENIKEYKDGVTGFSRSVDRVIKSRNYGLDIDLDIAHTMILKDEVYINTLVGILKNEEIVDEPSSIPTSARVTIINHTDHKISELYIKDQNSDEWGKDLIHGFNNISKENSKEFITLECDKNIDIKTAGIIGGEMEILDQYIDCGKKYSFEFK